MYNNFFIILVRFRTFTFFYSTVDLYSFIRDVPDFPQEGIVFKDITPLLQDGMAFQNAIDSFYDLAHGLNLDKIVAVESRGFIFGAPLANRLGIGIAVARKKGKLPYTTISSTYTLEYGTNTIEMHTDSILPGERVLIIDDVLATGGTAAATADLVHQLGGELVGFAFLIQLGFLKGAAKLADKNIFSILRY